MQRASEISYCSLILVLIMMGTVAFSPIPIALASSLSNVSTDTGPLDGILIKSISTRYDPELGSFHLFGEIINAKEDWSAANIMINATFYGSASGDQNVIIGNMSDSPYNNFLNPGEKSAFELISYGQAAGELANFSYYSISAIWDKVQENKPGLLKLQVGSILLDSCGNYHITGTVTNYDRHDTQDVVVSVAFYNNRNQIVATSYTKLSEDQEILAPTKSDSFTFVIEKSTLPHFAYYSLGVQSANYSLFSSNNEETSNLGFSSSSSNEDESIPTIAVSSNSTIYGIGSNAINISGRVYYPSLPHRAEDTRENRGSDGDPRRVLIKIMTSTSNTLERITAPLFANGTFSSTINFVSLQGSEGQVYRIRAEYDRGVSENTFAIGYDSMDHDLIFNNTVNNPVIQTSFYSSKLCREIIPSPLSIAQLGWKSISNVDFGPDTDHNDNSNNSEVSYSHHHRGKINVDSTVMLSAIAKNELSKPRPMVIVFEVIDASGAIVFLHLDNSTLDSGQNSTYESNVPWSPNEAGVFTLKTFAISGFDQPRILSSPVQITLNVSQD